MEENVERKELNKRMFEMMKEERQRGFPSRPIYYLEEEFILLNEIIPELSSTPFFKNILSDFV